MLINVEEAIQEAQRDGRFSNIPGQGQPLNLDVSDDAVIKNLLNEAKVRPLWIEVAATIDDFAEQAARLTERYAARHEAELALLLAPPHKPCRPQFWRRCWEKFWRGSDNRLRRGDPITAFNRHWDATVARYAALLHQANQQIRRFNHLAPGRHQQRNVIDIAARLQDFCERFRKIAQSQDGTIYRQRADVPQQLLTPPQTSTHHTPRAVRQRHILDTRK